MLKQPKTIVNGAETTQHKIKHFVMVLEQNPTQVVMMLKHNLTQFSMVLKQNPTQLSMVLKPCYRIQI